MKRAGEDKFNELHMLVTTELINRIRSGEATTAVSYTHLTLPTNREV